MFLRQKGDSVLITECFQLTLFELLHKDFGFTVHLSLSFLPCKCFVSIASDDGG